MSVEAVKFISLLKKYAEKHQLIRFEYINEQLEADTLILLGDSKDCTLNVMIYTIIDMWFPALRANGVGYGQISHLDVQIKNMLTEVGVKLFIP